MEVQTISMVLTWRDVAIYALSFAGVGLVTLLTVAGGVAKWVISRVLAGQEETNIRIDKLVDRVAKFEEHVNDRLLGLDRRVTRVEAVVRLPTPIPGAVSEDFRG